MASPYWQAKVGAHGEIVEDEADVVQCFSIILLTRLGHVPHRPEFGSRVMEHLDRPWPAALPLVVRDALAAIRRWEPRAQIKQISVEPLSADGDAQRRAHVRLTLVWAWAGRATTQTAEVLL